MTESGRLTLRDVPVRAIHELLRGVCEANSMVEGVAREDERLEVEVSEAMVRAIHLCRIPLLEPRLGLCVFRVDLVLVRRTEHLPDVLDVGVDVSESDALEGRRRGVHDLEPDLEGRGVVFVQLDACLLGLTEASCKKLAKDGRGGAEGLTLDAILVNLARCRVRHRGAVLGALDLLVLDGFDDEVGIVSDGAVLLLELPVWVGGHRGGVGDASTVLVSGDKDGGVREDGA